MHQGRLDELAAALANVPPRAGRSRTVPLLDPAMVGRVLAEPRAKISAPLGFGDNIRGSPIVGTVPAFVDYLSGGLSEGRVFATEGEAVAAPKLKKAKPAAKKPAKPVAKAKKPAKRQKK